MGLILLSEQLGPKIVCRPILRKAPPLQINLRALPRAHHSVSGGGSSSSRRSLQEYLAIIAASGLTLYNFYTFQFAGNWTNKQIGSL